ncbi:hypothetical protein [Burkholderia cepacia]|nr:hypothetical protein [Burkholderia cepacia]MDO5948046.1 hypothetical protein [Burkholderia cepacia]
MTYGNPYGDAALFGTLDDLSVEELDVLLADIARGQPWPRFGYRSRE